MRLSSKIKYRISEKKDALLQFRETLNKTQQKRFDKVLAIYKDLSSHETFKDKEADLLKISKKENILEELRTFIQKINDIILTYSIVEMDGFKLGQKVFLLDKPLIITQLFENATFIHKTTNQSLDKSTFLCLVTSEPRIQKPTAFPKSQSKLIDNVSQTVITSDMTHFLEYCAANEYDFEAYYQRGYVWTEKQKQDYIIALFNGNASFKPIFVKNTWEKYIQTGYYYEIMDGKQRSDAILSFINNEYPVNGHYFKDLSITDTQRFLNIKMEYTLIKNHTSNQKDAGLTQEQAIELFLQINDYGTHIDKDHLEAIKAKYLK